MAKAKADNKPSEGEGSSGKDGVFEVSAKLSNDDRVFSTTYKFGANLDEAVALFGADAVYNNFRQQATIGLQSLIRRNLTPDKEGKTATDEEIQAAVDAWKPGSKQVTRKSAVEKAQDAIGKMSEDEKAELLKQLMGDS